MKTPKLSIKDGIPCVEGDFKFERGPIIIDPIKQDTYFKVTFTWNPEFNNTNPNFNNEEIKEIIAEKLKQDFLKNDLKHE